MRALRLRTQLVLLVLAASLPLLAFAATMGAWSARQHERDIEDGLRHTASALALAVHRDLGIGIAMLEAISGSRSLDAGDFEAVYRLVKPVGERFNGWVGVLSPAGDYHLSTLVPYGTQLPRVLRTDAVIQAARTGQPVLTDLGRGGVSGRYIASLLVPVMREGRPLVVLGLALGPERLAGLLAEYSQSPQQRWVLIDGASHVVARSHDQDRHVGQPGPQWMTTARRDPIQVSRGASLDGISVVGAAVRVPGTTWTVGVAVANQVLAEAWWRSVGAIIIGGLAIVVVLVGGAIYVSQRLARPFSELATAADGVVSGEAPLPPIHRMSVQEFLTLRDALAKAGVTARQAAEASERVAVAEAEARTRVHSEERLRFLVNELDHRVKNVLAAIQALALQTGRTAESVPDFLTEFQARLMALSSVHDLLGSAARSASLRAVIAKTIAPYAEGDRIVVVGDDAEIAPEPATALAMAVHELATNAHKHGALSLPTGRVTIAIRVAAHQEPRVAIRWAETGGPEVQGRSRRGFGTKLLEGVLANQLEGEVALDFAPAGLNCAIEFPLGKAA